MIKHTKLHQSFKKIASILGGALILSNFTTFLAAKNVSANSAEVTKLFFDPVNNQISEADQLNLQKVLTYQNHQISFRNKIYLRRMSFSKRLKEKAIDFCRDCQKSNLGSFLVEETNYLTVWIENSMLDLA